jgi:hypothetical protein
MNIYIADELLSHLNTAAKPRFEQKCQGYAKDLLDEAGRLEASSHSGTGEPEITSTMIEDADIHIRRGYRKSKRPWWLIPVQLSSYLTAIFIGPAYENLAEDNGPFIFAGLVLLGVVTATAVVVRDR